MEQLIPGLVDEVADREAAARLRESRPGRIVLVRRAVPEYGGGTLADYAPEVWEVLRTDYAPEVSLSADGSEAAVLARRQPVP